MLDVESTTPSPKGNDNMSDKEENIFIVKKKHFTMESDDDDHISNFIEGKTSNVNLTSDVESINSKRENYEKCHRDLPSTIIDRNVPSVERGDSNLSDEDTNIFLNRKKKTNTTINDDSDCEKSISRENDSFQINAGEEILNNGEDSAGSVSETHNKSKLTKRIVMKPQNDDSDSDLSDADNIKSVRIQDHRKELTDKFKSMTNKKKSYKSNDEYKKHNETVIEDSIKPKSTENLYDSEESDYDAEAPFQADAEILSKKRKNVKPSPKIQRMSAKQAVENMQVIKIESNRMLREKQISLPYHKPRQITLKEIMEKRRPILGPGGKQLRVKMNEEQLRDYAQQLEERQKKVIELYKSESEDEMETNKEGDEDIVKNEKNNFSESESTIMEIENIDNKNIILNNKELKSVNDSKIESCNVNQIDISGDIVEKAIKINGNNTNLESQEISLNYNSEMTAQVLDRDVQESFKNDKVSNEVNFDGLDQDKVDIKNKITQKRKESTDIGEGDNFNNNFSDVDMSCVEEAIRKFEDDNIDDNKENENQNVSKIICNDNVKPKLSGAPGTIINLDSNDPESAPRKLSGIDRLKERFMYFSKIKTPEELEREQEKKMTPGALHLKLKQELEEEIAKQRAEEWAKRLAEECMKQEEMKAINGDESEMEDILDEIEKQEVNELDEEDSSETEEDDSELEENNVDRSEKPKKENPFVDAEAEEVNEDEEETGVDDEINEQENIEEIEEETESSESEEEVEEDSSKKKPSRILKVFIDSSDDENGSQIKEVSGKELAESLQKLKENEGMRKSVLSDDMFATQDYKECVDFDHEEDIPSAQKNTSISENTQNLSEGELENAAQKLASEVGCLSCTGDTEIPDVCAILKMDSVGQTGIENIIGMCSAQYPTQSESLIESANNKSPIKNLITGDAEKQCIDEDVLSLCTGKFIEGIITNDTSCVEVKGTIVVQETLQTNLVKPSLKDSLQDTSLRELLGLDEEQEFSLTKKRFFLDPEVKNQSLSEEEDVNSRRNNSKLVLLSSDDEHKAKESKSKQKKLKSKRDRLRRTIKMTDDEDSDNAKSYVGDEETEFSLVEYDSEENEIPVTGPETAKIQKKKKLKASDFFENEAELTSEDEWQGSGDEDEKGLDQLEWEEGDSDKLDQKKVQQELERIHLNQMMDQDKREVRLLQEILLDEDEPGGTRQRKFKWKNADWGTEEVGTVPEESIDADDEVETEEQWRRQRHERDVFLREMIVREHKEKKKEDDVLNVSFCRTSIIKANLESKTMSSMLLEVKTAELHTSSEERQSVMTDRKLLNKDLPSPVKKPFGLIQQHGVRGSLLSRGKSSLERLAALAKPIVGAQDEEARPANLNLLAPGKKRSFVFTTVSPSCLIREMEEETKLVKRKADTEQSTPHLIKKMRITDGGKSRFKKSLLDHIE